jgi:hypothetical protein
MEIKNLKANLLNAIEMYQGRPGFTGEIRIDAMASDCYSGIVELEQRLAALQQENDALKSARDTYRHSADKYQNINQQQIELIKKIKTERDELKKALELSCYDAADGCCPADTFEYDCGKTQTCPNYQGNREDSGLDQSCWYEYYIKKAKEELGK